MPNDETLDLEQNPVQQAEELELETTVEGKSQAGDPLDEIQDPDALRAEAKKFRAISNRHKKTVEVEKKDEEPKPIEAETPFLRKSDFELANQKKAIRLATTIASSDSDEVKAMKADMLENWDQVRSKYRPERGKSTPEDIAEDIYDAYTLFNARRTKTEGKPDLTALVATGARGIGNPPAPKAEVKNPPNFKTSATPDSWYKKS